jgi:cyclic pyranopterin monophosphate synthase
MKKNKPSLSHTDKNGNARMVDVSGKTEQIRIAKATGIISLNEIAIGLIRDNLIKKGDVLTVAQIAGVQAAKRTYEMIPLCHPLSLSMVNVRCTLTDRGVKAESEVKCSGQTGVEMEALTAVSVALLTVYDMCKAVDKNMKISNIILKDKTKTDIIK